jgi:hypothetical protein
MGTNKTCPVAWLVLVWRLPSSESSATRVSVWRSVRRLGAVGLTPGAAILPFSEEAQEQFDWLADEIQEHGGDAWVLPVAHLSEREERAVTVQMRADRQAEYADLRREALEFLKPEVRHPGQKRDYSDRLRTEKELLAFQRRFRKIRGRDFLAAPGRREAAAAIDKCLAFRQGISTKLEPVTDPPVGAGR